MRLKDSAVLATRQHDIKSSLSFSRSSLELQAILAKFSELYPLLLSVVSMGTASSLYSERFSLMNFFCPRCMELRAIFLALFARFTLSNFLLSYSRSTSFAPLPSLVPASLSTVLFGPSESPYRSLRMYLLVARS